MKRNNSRQSVPTKQIHNIFTNIELSNNDLDRARIKDSQMSELSSRNQIYALESMKTNNEVINSGSLMNILVSNFDEDMRAIV